MDATNVVDIINERYFREKINLTKNYKFPLNVDDCILFYLKERFGSWFKHIEVCSYCDEPLDLERDVDGISWDKLELKEDDCNKIIVLGYNPEKEVYFRFAGEFGGEVFVDESFIEPSLKSTKKHIRRLFNNGWNYLKEEYENLMKVRSFRETCGLYRIKNMLIANELTKEIRIFRNLDELDEEYEIIGDNFAVSGKESDLRNAAYVYGADGVLVVSHPGDFGLKGVLLKKTD